MSGRLEKIKRMALEDLLNVNHDYAATGYAHLSYAACLGALLARKRAATWSFARRRDFCTTCGCMSARLTVRQIATPTRRRGRNWPGG